MAGMVDRSDRVCVVGAGPAGLSLARALTRLGVTYDQYERHTDVGGIWDLENPGTPMYESAHFISSRKMSGFLDFPMPETYPDYPSNRQILDYTHSFADAYGLRDRIRFGAEVTRVTRDQNVWQVGLGDGSQSRYRAVVCATGVTWTPRLPTHPGRLGGDVRHAVTYRSPLELRGKRVLVVGLGNSGADIACDAAANAEEAFVSVRRGYHLIPKHVFGVPADEFGESGPTLPLRVERPVFTAMLRLLLGDLTRLGLPKPDHKLFESHPLLNDQIVHHLQHGDLTVKPDVAALEGDRVRFVDGSTEEIDLLLYATGYEWAIPYVPPEYFHWQDGHPQLYLTAFNPLHHTLIGLGYLETNSSAYPLFDHVSNVVANYLHDLDHAPDRARAFGRLVDSDEADLSGGINFLPTPRHRFYADSHALKKNLARVADRVGWQQLTPGMHERIRTRAR